MEWANSLLAEGLHTLPSSIEREKAANIFMRVRTPEMQAILGCDDPEKCMNILRQSKTKGIKPAKI